MTLPMDWSGVGTAVQRVGVALETALAGSVLTTSDWQIYLNGQRVALGGFSSRTGEDEYTVIKVMGTSPGIIGDATVRAAILTELGNIATETGLTRYGFALPQWSQPHRIAWGFCYHRDSAGAGPWSGTWAAL